MTEHEKQLYNPEIKGAQEAAAERSAELRKKPEAYENREATERQTEHAAKEAKENALSTERHRRAEATDKTEDQPATASKKVRERSYTHTMGIVQSQMSPPARLFSKIIHNPIVERTTEVVGNTIARPAAILSGSAFAFAAVAVVYVTAKFIGFALQGSETIVAFVVGWALGLIFDVVRLVVFRKR